MGLFRPQSTELMKRSPMLLSVPIGGTDTVVGLRPLAYGQDSGVTHDEARIATKSRTAPPQLHPRSFYRRYKGPYLESLTKDAWKRPPKSWRHFLYGQTSEFVYNMPENTEHMQERMEENLVRYLSNYIWFAASLMLCSLMMNWAASLGICGLCLTIWLNVEYPPPSTNARQVQVPWAALRACAAIVTWLLILYTRSTSVLIKWSGLTLLAVLSHTSLRVTVTEGNYSTSSRTHPGVPFALFFSNAPSRDYPEPRRVAHELSAIVRDQSRSVWNQAKFYSYYLLDAIRYPYVLYHHATDRQPN